MKKALALLVTMIAWNAQADTLTWVETGTGSWDVDANWSGSLTPSSADTALIENGGTAVLGGGTEGYAGVLVTGSSGVGTAVVAGGYLAVVGDSSFGYDATAHGTAIVSSGTWIAGNIILGSSGTGTLTISGGTVYAGGEITLGADTLGRGSIALTNGGVLSAGNIVVGSGVGTFHADGGTLLVQEDEAAFFDGFADGAVTLGAGGLTVESDGNSIATEAVISGSGGITKNGAGALTLKGASTYTGPTVVNEGALRVGGYTALGTGVLTINSGTLGNAVFDEMAVLENDIEVTSDFVIDAQGVDMGSVEMFGSVDLGDDPLRTITLTGDGLACFGGIITGQDLTFVTTGSFSQVMFCSDTTNQISGTVTVGEGVRLQLWKIFATAISGDLVIDAGGSVDLMFQQQFAGSSSVEVNGILRGQTSDITTFNTVSGTGVITGDMGADIFSINSGTFDGTLQDGDGTLELVKHGAGTLALTGSNSYTQGTTVQSGTLSARNNHAVGNGTVRVNNNGVLRVEEGIALSTLSIELANNGTATFQKAFAEGEDLTNFHPVTSTGTNATTAEILYGTASDEVTATARFSETPSTPAMNDQYRISDVFSLSGLEDEVFVIQLSFTEEAYEAQVLAGLITSKLELSLGWLDGNEWSPVAEGMFVDGEWNASYLTLGTYGVDRNNNVVWAVTNQNGEIAVVPEPSTWALIGLGVLLLAMRRRKAISAYLR